jgi:hypothetical protein
MVLLHLLIEYLYLPEQNTYYYYYYYYYCYFAFIVLKTFAAVYRKSANNTILHEK